MSATTKERVRALLKEHGQTFAQELQIPMSRESPSGLFRLLCASMLFGARISARIAADAARALAHEGWTTPAKLGASSWEQRTRVLNRSGYARYDESTSRRLGRLCEELLDSYHGDLRRLREAAQRDPGEERRLLLQFNGMGPVSVDIFFREVQGLWGELYPFADARALAAARALDLGAAPGDLAPLVPQPQFTKLVAALVRWELAREKQPPPA